MTTIRMAGIALAASLLAAPASAQVTPCGPSSAILKSLADKYQEQVVFSGVGKNGAEFLVTLSPKGSWTVVRLGKRNGMEIACLMAAGQQGTVTVPKVGEPT